MSTTMLRLGIKPGQWGWRFDQLTAAWERIERLGFHVVSCFDHVTAEPRGNRAWDAPTLLAAMAGRTQKITLAIDVVNVSLRHPFLLAAQLAVAQAASRGRLEVGLGAGSYGLARFDHQALGIAFPPLADRLARLDGCVRTLPRLWRGETVTDPQLDLHAASLGPLGIEPPLVIVGGASPRLLETAVRYADGWNVPYIAPAEWAARARCCVTSRFSPTTSRRRQHEISRTDSPLTAQRPWSSFSIRTMTSPRSIGLQRPYSDESCALRPQRSG